MAIKLFAKKAEWYRETEKQAHSIDEAIQGIEKEVQEWMSGGRYIQHSVVHSTCACDSGILVSVMVDYSEKSKD